MTDDGGCEGVAAAAAAQRCASLATPTPAPLSRCRSPCCCPQPRCRLLLPCSLNDHRSTPRAVLVAPGAAVRCTPTTARGAHRYLRGARPPSPGPQPAPCSPVLFLVPPRNLPPPPPPHYPPPRAVRFPPSALSCPVLNLPFVSTRTLRCAGRSAAAQRAVRQQHYTRPTHSISTALASPDVCRPSRAALVLLLHVSRMR